MANVRSGNVWHVDSTGSLQASTDNKGVKIKQILLTTSNTNATTVIQHDITGTPTVLTLSEAASGVTKQFDFSSSPINLTQGIKVSTLTNCKLMFIVEGGGST